MIFSLPGRVQHAIDFDAVLRRAVVDCRTTGVLGQGKRLTRDCGNGADDEPGLRVAPSDRMIFDGLIE